MLSLEVEISPWTGHMAWQFYVYDELGNSSGQSRLSEAWGPSINDVASKGEGGGYQKWQFGAIFKA